ncbi:hypothetical protein KEJ34_06345 [Candidatus Bathyarchaeota archaeon]|nr:hypothetical protein [Candidatus Bathyarchaeota archaeon]
MNRKFRKYGVFILLGIIVPVAINIILLSEPVNKINFRIGNYYYYEFKYGGSADGETIIIREEAPSDPEHPISIPPYPPFVRYSLATGINVILDECGRIPLLLPTWLPEGMKYADVYIGPVIIIIFSYEKVEDFRFAEFGIQIKRVRSRGLEELNKTVEYARKEGDNDIELMKIGEIWAVVVGRVNMAWFFKDDYYYIVGVKAPLTLQDMIKIIESLKPIT